MILWTSRPCLLFSFHPVTRFMKAIQILALAGLSLVAMSNSCHSEEAAAPVPVPDCPRILPVADLPLVWTFGSPQRNVGDMDNHVINSDSAYQALYANVPYPQPAVDFRTHTLLIGKILVNTSAMTASQQVTKTCTGRYTYAVQITRNVGQAYMDVLYHAVVDKLPANAQVDFAVQVMPF